MPLLPFDTNLLPVTHIWCSYKRKSTLCPVFLFNRIFHIAQKKFWNQFDFRTLIQGDNQIWTGDQGVADPRLTTWLCRHNDSYENRTRVTAVKGRCLNRLTKEPDLRYKYARSMNIPRANSPSWARTNNPSVNSRMLYHWAIEDHKGMCLQNRIQTINPTSFSSILNLTLSCLVKPSTY